jgi:lactoylglutathione lyase
MALRPRSMGAQRGGRIIAFGHVGLQVADLDRSRAFYREVIGLVEIERGVRADLYLQHLTGYQGVELDSSVLVEPGSGVLLELLEYRGVERNPVDPATANPGTGHVCFEVDDVDAIYRRALDAGHRAVDEPVTPTSGRWTDGRSVYLLDPDGIRVELVQQGGDPGTIESESVFLAEATFAPDAAERRRPHRSAHLERIAELRREGVVIEVGAFLDALSSSVLLIRAGSVDEARRITEEDIYVKTGVWTDVRVRPFGRVASGPRRHRQPSPG